MPPKISTFGKLARELFRGLLSELMRTNLHH